MIINIDKRKKLAQMVYNGYGEHLGIQLTCEDKKELENKVGAAFNGYELAMKDIEKLIDENKTLQEIKQFIKTIKR